MATVLSGPEHPQDRASGPASQEHDHGHDSVHQAALGNSEGISVVLRDFVPETDRNFVLATWINGQRYGNPYFKSIEQEAYFKHFGAHIRKIVDDGRNTIGIACSQSDPRWIAGFCVSRGPELYWIHVRDGFRNRGIAKLMLPQGIRIVKSLTKIGSSIAKRKGFPFDPY